MNSASSFCGDWRERLPLSVKIGPWERVTHKGQKEEIRKRAVEPPAPHPASLAAGLTQSLARVPSPINLLSPQSPSFPCS